MSAVDFSFVDYWAGIAIGAVLSSVLNLFLAKFLSDSHFRKWALILLSPVLTIGIGIGYLLFGNQEALQEAKAETTTTATIVPSIKKTVQGGTV